MWDEHVWERTTLVDLKPAKYFRPFSATNEAFITGLILIDRLMSADLCSTFWISSLWNSTSCSSCLCFLRSSLISTSSWFVRPSRVSASSLAARYSCLFSAALCLSFSRDLLNWPCSALRHESWTGELGKLKFTEIRWKLIKISVKEHKNLGL